MRIEVLSTSLSEDSHSRWLLQRINTALEAAGAEVGFVDARALPPILCDGRPTEAYPDAYQQLIHRLEAADGVIVGTPIHNYGTAASCINVLSISGAGLNGKPVAVVSASGSSRSHLAIGPLMLSLAFEFGALLYPESVQVCDGDRDDPALSQRIARFSAGFAAYVAALAQAAVRV